LIIVAVTLGVVFGKYETTTDVVPANAPVNPITPAPALEPNTTLERIYQRGFLRCGINESHSGFAKVNLGTGKYEGFDVDMVGRINLILLETTPDQPIINASI
jgi:ABC-type amino acid transport substrate-binding protein